MKKLLQGTGVAGAALAVLVPFAKCPICAAAAAGVLGSLGIAGLGLNPWFVPALIGVLVIGLWGFFQSARAYGKWFPFALAMAGSAGILAGRVFESSMVLWVGGSLLALALFLDVLSKQKMNAGTMRSR